MCGADVSVTLVVPSSIAAELETVAKYSVETAGVLLVSVIQSGTDIRLLVRELRWVDESAYAVRESDSLSITSLGYVHPLADAERMGATAIWLHTHPGTGSSPIASRHDAIVDRQLAELFRIRTGSAHYGSLIVSPMDQGLAFTGFVEANDTSRNHIDRFWIVGDRFRMIQCFGSEVSALSNAFDRNVRAFGSAIQATLADLHIGIVGCGGTGSAVAEQLTRLGVRRFTLVDPDELSPSNLTRVYGATPGKIGSPKVDVLSDHLRSIAPEARVMNIKSSVMVEATAKSLLPCDVIFGCTDDNAGRLVLSRLATYLIVPVIDCGVLLSADAAYQLTGIHGRITTLVPGQACLVCRGRIDLQRAAAEALTPEERIRLADEGYAPALGAVEPAVVTFTTAVASAAVSEFLERLVGYGPEPRPSEVLLRFHDREISTNCAAPLDRHYCNENSGRVGIGAGSPFLDQLWSA
jgi:hypothetical protein